MRTEIRLSGFGGQGIGLAGFILGKALCLFDGLETVMTQAYGPEARGGASSTNIVVDDQPIDYPFIQQADILVALSQEAYTRFRQEVKSGATIIIDDGLVTPDAEDQCHAIPATELAEGLGRRVVANVIMLVFFTAVTGLVKRQAMERAIETTVRPKTLELNKKAFLTGFEYAAKIEQAR